MPSRSRSRQRALQILFSWDTRRQPVDDAIDAYFSSLYSGEQPEHDLFAAELVRGVAGNTAGIDARIAKHAEHWRVERMPAVDRNILRLAVFELSGERTPAPVVIDEAIELARKFSSEESAQFVNGVLDAIHREDATQHKGSGES
jgi:transcription antitermination protein NusB